MTTAWPNVVNWLVANLPTITGLPSAYVFDGPPVTGDNPLVYITVGWVPEGAEGLAGQYTQARSYDGLLTSEQGSVRCDLVANTGDDGVAAVRTQAFAIADLIAGYFAHDQTLGGVLYNGSVTLTVDVVAAANQQGVAQGLVLTVAYTTDFI
jgi:hypothetical protein